MHPRRDLRRAESRKQATRARHIHARTEDARTNARTHAHVHAPTHAQPRAHTSTHVHNRRHRRPHARKPTRICTPPPNPPTLEPTVIPTHTHTRTRTRQRPRTRARTLRPRLGDAQALELVQDFVGEIRLPRPEVEVCTRAANACASKSLGLRVRILRQSRRGLGLRPKVAKEFRS